MDNEQIIKKAIEMFGDEIVDPEVFPKRARYQMIMAKFELEVEARNAPVVTEEVATDPPEETTNETSNSE